jgi:iduronate 2-sulfatase
LKKIFLHIALFITTTCSVFAQKQKPNVLFIMVDDLKPLLGCYGNTFVQSPNIDALAKTGTVFQNNYCQQAVCGPTRASLLTGLRPDKTKIWDLKAKLREVSPNVTTMPEYFKSQGYYTFGMGKIFDPSNTDQYGDEKSWSVPFQKTFTLAKGYEDIAFGIYQSQHIKDKVKADGDAGKDEGAFYGPNKNKDIRIATENLDVPDDSYMDGAMANYAIEQLKTLATSKQAFFMAVGFKKPHLPFVAPKKYWDLYDRNKIELASFTTKATNSPDVAYHNGGELKNYAADIKPLNDKGSLTLQLAEEKQKELLHGYYACVSYTDAQIGKLLAALKASGLDKNTIVVLLGDHGWHLGDHSLWCKHSNFEQATKAPLIISAPGTNKGKVVNGITEFVDIFPTLCDLSGIKKGNNLDGKSLVPTLKNNNAATKDFAVSQYPRGAGDGAKEIMGYSIRTKQYRYTEWINKFTTIYNFDITKLKAIELYDYKNDPLETKNIADDAAMKKVVADLQNKIRAFYKQQNKTIAKIQ